MTGYDPEQGPEAGEWLALDESERLAMVESYHRQRRIRLPQPRLHAAIHVVVENQLAEGERAAIEAMGRLRSEGLDRHDAVHAIGGVVAENLADIVKKTPQVAADPTATYRDRLNRLTAEGWRTSDDDGGS